MKNKIANFLNAIRREPVLPTILCLAFLLRIVGIGYGLPLTVVSDETPFTYAALQMIQSHTLVPAFYPELFKNILPYPPYISYILIVPFVAILGVKYVFWHGTAAFFQAHLLTDLSAFFMIARLVNVFLGVFSVYLVYRIGETWFRSRIAAAAAAFLLATSLLHLALSMVGRNWMPVSVIFLLILYILTRPTWSMSRRYTLGFIVAGIGIGISSAIAIAAALMALFYLIFDARSFRDALSDLPRMLLGAAAFVLLAVVPFLLWHTGGKVFLGAVTVTDQKTFVGLLTSPWSALSLVAFSEPILIGLFLGGLFFLCTRYKKIFIFIAGWLLLYVGIFYFAFRFEPRFILPIMPFLALAGGYCVERLWDRRSAVVLCVLLCVPLVAATRLSLLSMQGDTREQAREWSLAHLQPSDKVLVYASEFHLPTTADAVAELRGIDPSALRKVDGADEVLNRKDVPFVLNSLMLVETSFVQDLPKYAAAHGYRYLVLEPDLVENSTTTAPVFASLTAHASAVARFDGFGSSISISDSAFTKPLTDLFAPKALGPDIVIYRLGQ